ncbi:MAG: ECF-type sigma factor [Planctomycetota bacterium]
MRHVTDLLSETEREEGETTDELFLAVYQELRRLAASKLADERPGQTLQPTALVHEAYLRLVDRDKAKEWNSRKHFFFAAAESMRQILVNHAIRKGRVKHGGDRKRVEFHDDLQVEVSGTEICGVSEGLDALAKQDPVSAQIVSLKIFTGLEREEVARMLGLSPRTLDRRWAYARAWLFDFLRSNI